ncbi:hypothetical protein VTI74DRAFT_1199 [Chaetomium olivicolor]
MGTLSNGYATPPLWPISRQPEIEPIEIDDAFAHFRQGRKRKHERSPDRVGEARSDGSKRHHEGEPTGSRGGYLQQLGGRRWEFEDESICMDEPYGQQPRDEDESLGLDEPAYTRPWGTWTPRRQPSSQFETYMQKPQQREDASIDMDVSRYRGPWGVGPPEKRVDDGESKRRPSGAWMPQRQPNSQFEPYSQEPQQREDESIDLDESKYRRPSGAWRRGRRLGSQFPATSATDSGVEDTIANRSQGATPAPSAAVPTPASSSLPTTSRSPNATVIQATGYLEPDPDCVTQDGDDDIPPDLKGFNEGRLVLRSIPTAGGMRKMVIGGVAVEYRLAADAALRCRKVVRSKIRMRRRGPKKKKKEEENKGETSPVLSASGSPPMPAPRALPKLDSIFD